jgi:formamidopyrimidine-DNA glycosylase
MPELPEVETIRRQLQKLIVGKTISSIEVFNQNSFKAGKKSLIGNKVVGVGRKGKVITIALQGRALYIHLKMSGQLQFKEDGPLKKRTVLSRHKHLRVKIKFSDKSELWFIDQRKFGWITDNPAVLPLGIDAMDDGFTAEKLMKILQSSSRAIKTILLDQSKIAGIGNIYASEILWEAKILPFRKGQALLQQQGLALIKSIRKVLTESIKFGGSTMDDGLYQHVSGESGNYWSRRRVYDREGEPCLRCKTAIKKGVIGQRSTYWCPGCQ